MSHNYDRITYLKCTVPPAKQKNTDVVDPQPCRQLKRSQNVRVDRGVVQHQVELLSLHSCYPFEYNRCERTQLSTISFYEAHWPAARFRWDLGRMRCMSEGGKFSVMRFKFSSVPLEFRWKVQTHAQMKQSGLSS